MSGGGGEGERGKDEWRGRGKREGDRGGRER